MNLRIFCAYIAGLGAIGWSFFIIWMFSTQGHIKGDELLASILVLIPCATILYLIFSNKLYAISISERIEEQNKILKMKIEQKKLQAELKND